MCQILFSEPRIEFEYNILIGNVVKKKIFFVLSFLFINPSISIASDQSTIAVESRSTYTRWYEYPGTYYEEEFSFIGVRWDYYFDPDNAELLKYGFTGSLYPVGSYTSWPNGSEGATG